MLRVDTNGENNSFYTCIKCLHPESCIVSPVGRTWCNSGDSIFFIKISLSHRKPQLCLGYCSTSIVKTKKRTLGYDLDVRMFNFYRGYQITIVRDFVEEHAVSQVFIRFGYHCMDMYAMITRDT